jgi:hypothetical protein
MDELDQINELGVIRYPIPDVIDPEIIVKMIKLRGEGVIYKDIALYLSNKGYKSSRGKQLTGKIVSVEVSI